MRPPAAPDFPTPAEQHNILIAEITERELNGAISRLKARKTPGGFPSEQCRVFWNELLPCPLKACSANQKCHLRGMKWSFQSSLKTEKASYCGSYGPISVSNVDHKLFLPKRNKCSHILYTRLALFCRDKLMTTLNACHISYIIFNKPN